MGATARDTHIDALRSEMAMGYRPDGFIADMLFPVVNVDKQTDLFAKFSRATRLRVQRTARSPGMQANLIDEPVGSDSFHCKNYALKAAVTIEDKSNADPIFVSEIIDGRTRFVLDHLMLDWEVRVANQVTSTSNVGSSSAVASSWAISGGAGSPVSDINTAIDNIHDVTGKRPNNMVLGLSAWRSLRRHSEVRNLIFGTNNGGGFPSRAAVADLFEIENLMIGDAFQNTGTEQAVEAGFDAGESLSQIWLSDVLIYHAPSSPSRETPSFAYSFRWNQPGLPNMQVERHPYDSRTKSEEIEVGYYQDEKITGAEYAFLITDVNSNA